MQKLLTLWNRQKFRYFFFSHLLLIIGIVLVPFNEWYLYDLLIFSTVTWPLISLTQHSYFHHAYLKFRNPVFKWILLCHMTIYSYWKFNDIRSYHVTHHELWLTDKDPTAQEIRQGWVKYYFGLTDPVPIRNLTVSKKDKDLEFINSNFYLIKFVVLSLLLIILGIEWFVHLFLVQQFLMYFFYKFHDIVFHSTDKAKDKPWLYPIFGSDSFHIKHHKNFNKSFWMWDSQRIFKMVFFHHVR